MHGKDPLKTQTILPWSRENLIFSTIRVRTVSQLCFARKPEISLKIYSKY